MVVRRRPNGKTAIIGLICISSASVQDASVYDPHRLRRLHRLFLFRHLAGEVHPPRLIQPGVEAIELVLSGRGELELASGWTSVGPGDLVWHQHGERTIGHPDPQDPYYCLALRVQVEPGTPRPAPRRSHWEDVGAAAVFAREALLQWVDTEVDRHLLLHRLYATLLSVASQADRPDSVSLPAALVRVQARIDAEYDRDLSIADLAKTAGWRAQRLHEVCQQHLGRTPHAWLHERRLRAVRERLASSDQPLTVIARACGFSSPATLCRAFRQATGTSPDAWRRRYR